MKKLKILIIDDEVDYCMLLQYYFESKEYDVYLAFTLTEGMRLLPLVNPDVLILDNNLPDGEGWSKIDVIIDQLPDVKLYLISAYGELPELIKQKKNITFWEKPITISSLDSAF